MNRLVQEVLLAVSREIVRMDAPDDPDAAPDVPELHLPASPWEPLPALQVPTAATRWYGDGSPDGKLVLAVPPW